MNDNRILHLDLHRPLPNDLLQKIYDVIISSKLIICPTESSYLLGGNIFDKRVLEKIFSLKGRSTIKPLPAIVSDDGSARELVVFNDIADKLCARFWPGPLTIILPIRDKRLEAGYGQSGTLGLRVPAFPVLKQILEFIKLPLISTSANVSNAAEPYTLDDLIVSTTALAEEIDLVLFAGPLPRNPPSTVLDLSHGDLHFVREGALSRQIIETTLK